MNTRISKYVVAFMFVAALSMAVEVDKNYHLNEKWIEVKIGNVEVEEKIEAFLKKENILFFINEAKNINVPISKAEYISGFVSELITKIIPKEKSFDVNCKIYEELLGKLKESKVSYKIVSIFNSNYIVLERKNDIKILEQYLDELILHLLMSEKNNENTVEASCNEG